MICMTNHLRQKMLFHGIKGLHIGRPMEEGCRWGRQCVSALQQNEKITKEKDYHKKCVHLLNCAFGNSWFGCRHRCMQV